MAAWVKKTDRPEEALDCRITVGRSDQAALQKGDRPFVPRYAKKPRPAKPINIIVHVEGRPYCEANTTAK
jgi:hypothetical protein